MVLESALGSDCFIRLSVLFRGKIFVKNQTGWDVDVLIDDVIEIICEVRSELKVSDLSKDTQFDTLGLSSLELTEVILELEDKHDVEIDINTVDAAGSLKTVGDIVAILEDLLKSK